MNTLAEGAPIRVLLVEDSPTQRTFLLGLLGAEPDFVVVGTASTGAEAIAAAQSLRPNVIAMDILLPDLDGYEVTRRIMRSSPVPIVLIGADLAAVQRSHDAFAVGALSIVRKPSPIGSATHLTERKYFLTTLRLMAGVPVVTHHAPAPPLALPISPASDRLQLIALAASTGGPVAIQTILRGLDADFPLPLVVVQHIVPGFAASMVEWLGPTVPLPVQLAVSGTVLQPGHVYIAPDDQQMLVEPGGVIGLRAAVAADRFCPSADVLFSSVASVYGHRALGIVLTGMGNDGTRGLQALAAAGSMTLAQDEASCAVYGMPGAAVAAGAITRVVPLDDLAATICRLLHYTPLVSSQSK
jgi:two-component system chemotaxis response regulator CheB